MATDKYDLHTIDYSVQGWDSILATDMEKLDDVVPSRMLATLGETVSAGEALYLKSTDSKWYKAQADGTKQPTQGLACESGVLNDEIRIQRMDDITVATWSWATVGAAVYLSAATAGALTQVDPGGSFTQVIGYARSATKMLVTLVDLMPAAGSGISDIVEDVTPQLGGNLDLNTHDIGGVTQAELDAAVTATHTQGTDTALGAQVDALNMNTHKVTGVVDPTADQDAATKKYVDDNTDVVEDTTPQLGGDLEYNEKNQQFNTTLTSDDTASGDIITVTYGESVVFGQLVYPDATDNEWKLALGTNAAVKHPAMGIALETKADGESGKMLLRGTIRDATYFSGVAMGDIIFLSDASAGNYVTTAPSDSGDIVQTVGFAIAANYIFFNPDYTCTEIA